MSSSGIAGANVAGPSPSPAPSGAFASPTASVPVDVRRRRAPRAPARDRAAASPSTYRLASSVVAILRHDVRPCVTESPVAHQLDVAAAACRRAPTASRPARRGSAASPIGSALSGRTGRARSTSPGLTSNASSPRSRSCPSRVACRRSTTAACTAARPRASRARACTSLARCANIAVELADRRDVIARRASGVMPPVGLARHAVAGAARAGREQHEPAATSAGSSHACLRTCRAAGRPAHRPATPTLTAFAPTLIVTSCSIGAFELSLHAFSLYLPGARCLNANVPAVVGDDVRRRRHDRDVRAHVRVQVAAEPDDAFLLERVLARLAGLVDAEIERARPATSRTRCGTRCRSSGTRPSSRPGSPSRAAGTRGRAARSRGASACAASTCRSPARA